jgi:hypothetical protein
VDVDFERNMELWLEDSIVVGVRIGYQFACGDPFLLLPFNILANENLSLEDLNMYRTS